MNLRIKGRPKSIGTASTKGSVTVLGRTKSFYIYLEHIGTPVKVQPYVVRDLAHPINLGQAFLRAHNADMIFRPDGIQLKLNGKVTMLTTTSTNLCKPSIDSRFKELLDKWVVNGKNPMTVTDSILDLRLHGVQEKPAGHLPGLVYGENKRPVEFSTTHYKGHSIDEVLLKANHSTVVAMVANSVSCPEGRDVPENDVFLFPKKDSKFLNDNLIFVHPGTYTRCGDRINVLVSNFGKKNVRLPQKCTLGTYSEAVAYADAVNVLDHRPVEDLTSEELRERREYITTALRLDDNPVFKDTAVKEQVIQMFLENFDAVSVSEFDYGKTDLLKFHIEVPKGTQPIRAKVRPLNPMQEADLKKQIQAWEEARVIEPSLSPWASALVPCKKKGTQKLRWAVDFRQLNKVTVKDSYPLSNIDANLHKLSGAKVFTTLDSCGAFHSMCVSEESRDYTTFVSAFGSYRFCRLPFGLANAPAAYSRLVSLALSRLSGNFTLAYIDDVIVYSGSVAEHLGHLRQVLQLHVNAGMKLNLKKCNIAYDQVEYLGHKVSHRGIEMIDSYVDKILDWPLPMDAGQLKSFLGFSGYYRSFIKEYSKLTNEMNQMKNSKGPLVWTEVAKKNFELLKAAFKDKPLRGFPQYNTEHPFILDSDFSATNMACVLSQVQDGKETFLGCTAKKCDKAQRSYPSAKGELAAVILGLKKFEHILRAKPFIIRTDSKCVEFLQTMKEARGVYARWLAFLASFNFTTVHRSGKLQMNADPLSRRPGLPEDGEPDALEPDGYLQDVDDIYQVQADANPPLSGPKPKITLAALAKMTAKDPVLSRILEAVQSKVKPDKEARKGLTAIGVRYVNFFECLLVEDGVLYYQPPKVNGKQAQKRICLPTALYGLAFELTHGHPMGGHYGQQNTYRKLREHFYFPGMYSFVTAMVNNCVPCISKRPNRPKGDHKMHREKLSYFGQRVYCDTVGPMTGTMHDGKMCRHFVTIQDGYTRYLVCFPVEKIDAPSVAEAIVDKWILVFGCMEVIHSDQGSCFQSDLFKEVMKRLGVVQTHSPIYSPDANRVERSHRVLGNILRSDRRFDAKSWPQKLVAATMAYNCTYNHIIGVSPYEAVFGRRAVMPVDMVFPLPKEEGRSWSNYVESLKLRFADLAQKICKAQDSSLGFDHSNHQARSAVPFEKGDYCYYFLGRVKPGLSKKLQSRWIGPWVVRKVVSESLVVIYPAGSWAERPKELAAIVSRLRKVDPKLSMSVLNPSRRKRIDLPEILDDLDEMNEILSYQDTFEEENGSEIPRGLPFGPNPVITGDSNQGSERPGQPDRPSGPDGNGQPPPISPKREIPDEEIPLDGGLDAEAHSDGPSEENAQEDVHPNEAAGHGAGPEPAGENQPPTAEAGRNEVRDALRQVRDRHARNIARGRIHLQLAAGRRGPRKKL